MIIHSPHSDASAAASTMSDDVASIVIRFGWRYAGPCVYVPQ